MMLSLKIDGNKIPTIGAVDAKISFNGLEMSDLDRLGGSRDIALELLLPLEGEKFFSSEANLHAGTLFNNEAHKGEICMEDETILEGELSLLSIAREAEGLKIKLRLRIAAALWASLARSSRINKLELPFEMRLQESEIKALWTEESPVQFFPVHRDRYQAVGSSVASEAIRVERSIDEYHPFLNIRSMMHAIAEAGGYTIESKFVDSDFFGELYMSGAYSTQENTVLKSTMDFHVERLRSSSAQANSWGEVSLSAHDTLNSVGNFVDVSSIDSLGTCFSRSSCVSEPDGVLNFKPTTQISAGFEFRIRYITDYKIASRDSLSGFDSFYLYDGLSVEAQLANNFVDRKSETLARNFEYLVYAFDNKSSMNMRLMASVQGYYSDQVLCSFTSTSSRFTTNSSQILSIRMEYYSSGRWTDYPGDWALYEGWVQESGQVEVDATFRTAPNSYSPDSPFVLSSMKAKGADYGMQFTLLEGSSLSPIFAQYPGSGALINFEDVAQQPYSQLKFLQAVQHLFCLRFVSDERARILYVEPAEELCSTNLIWDWTNRIVDRESIAFEDVALDVYKQREWAYRADDGLITRSKSDFYDPFETLPSKPEDNPEQSVSGASCSEFGAWSIEIPSSLARQESVTLLNPMFSPTLNDTKGIPVVGDRDDALTVDTLQFSPRILRFVGLIDGENEGLPNAVFYSEAEQTNLCFEDRGTLRGLNTYYNAQIEREQGGRYLSLTLKLSPHEVSQLLSPADGGASLLSTFGFLIDGEWVNCRLHSFDCDSLASGLVRCKFVIV